MRNDNRCISIQNVFRWAEFSANVFVDKAVNVHGTYVEAGSGLLKETMWGLLSCSLPPPAA